MWKRTLIRQRLAAVLGSIGAAEFVHNRQLTTDKRPGIQLLDADEIADRAAFGRGRPNNSPNLVTMTPEIYVILENKKPANPLIGDELDEFTATLLKAVITDPELNELVGSNGEIRYDGFATDLGEDRAIEGKARVGISFVYVFRPTEL